MTTILKTITAACMAFGMLACAPTKSVASRIDTNIECRNICNRYATCYDPAYSVRVCSDNCREKARADGDYRRMADACNECMLGNACNETSASCSTDCGELIPLPPVTSSR